MARRRNLAVEGVSGGGYTATIRAEYANKPGMLGRVASVIGEAGGDIGSIDLVEASRDKMVRDISVSGSDSDHIRSIIDKIKKLLGRRARRINDRRPRGGSTPLSTAALHGRVASPYSAGEPDGASAE